MVSQASSEVVSRHVERSPSASAARTSQKKMFYSYRCFTEIIEYSLLLSRSTNMHAEFEGLVVALSAIIMIITITQQ